MTTTIQAHDFYIGRGPHAVYLGTAFIHAGPEKLTHTYRMHTGIHPADGRDTPYAKYTADTWVQRVEELFTHRDGITGERVSTTWPHPYSDTPGTEWTWAFDTGAIYLYRHGELKRIYYPNGGSKSRITWPQHEVTTP